MSQWRYVSGIIKGSSLGCETQAESDNAVAKAVQNLPQVTGSERNMTITVVPIDRVTSSIWDENCNVEVEIKEEYNIIVNGQLRDREFDETLREFGKFMNRLAKRIWVEDTLVEISNGYYAWNKKYVINDHLFYGTLTD